MSDPILTPEKSRAFLSKLAPFSMENPNLPWKNGWFEDLDVDVLYSFCRAFKPGRVLELGRGISTSIMREAAQKNTDCVVEHVSIDPQTYSNAGNVARLEGGTLRYVNAKTEEAVAPYVEWLEAGDLLFIDSSHSSQEQDYIVANVYPKLKMGVYVHHHDVMLHSPDWKTFCPIYGRGHQGATGEVAVLMAYLLSGENRLTCLHSNHLIAHDEAFLQVYRELSKFPESGVQFAGSLYSVVQ